MASDPSTPGRWSRSAKVAVAVVIALVVGLPILAVWFVTGLGGM